MKIFLSFIIGMVLAFDSAMAGAGAVTISAPVCVLPEVGKTATVNWEASRAYTNAMYVVMTNTGKTMMCLVAGTSTNAGYPAASVNGADVSDGTVVWRPVSLRCRGRYVQNVSAGGTAYLSVQFPAAANTGIQLLGYGGAWYSDVPPVVGDEVWVAPEAGNILIITGEW